MVQSKQCASRYAGHPPMSHGNGRAFQGVEPAGGSPHEVGIALATSWPPAEWIGLLCRDALRIGVRKFGSEVSFPMAVMKLQERGILPETKGVETEFVAQDLHGLPRSRQRA